MKLINFYSKPMTEYGTIKPPKALSVFKIDEEERKPLTSPMQI